MIKLNGANKLPEWMEVVVFFSEIAKLVISLSVANALAEKQKISMQ
jgi:hypothetical protein